MTNMFLAKAAKAYYEGNPIISDAEFDVLAADADYALVGYSDEFFEFEHMYPMYSLQKAFVGAEHPPYDHTAGATIITPKLDGAAVSLGYYDGELVLALTRGNGKKGRNIMNKVKHLVPTSITRKGVVQITGEVVAPETIPNARNYASGALNLKSEEEFLTREVRFVAYDIQPRVEKLWTEDMSNLSSDNFDTVLASDWAGYPQDGIVFRVNDNAEYEEMGYTSHHPRGAFALKERPAGVVTKLLDVIWQVGKSGVVSPVAILEPVMVGEAQVARATLHNMRYINELNLEIGCNVEVIRSGEIIPRVVRRVEGEVRV